MAVSGRWRSLVALIAELGRRAHRGAAAASIVPGAKFTFDASRDVATGKDLSWQVEVLARSDLPASEGKNGGAAAAATGTADDGQLLSNSAMKDHAMTSRHLFDTPVHGSSGGGGGAWGRNIHGDRF